MTCPVFHLEQSQWLPRPVEEVFGFFSRAGNLQRVTPPLLHFSILTPEPIEMTVGTLIDYRLKVHGIPLRWRSQITAWDPPFRFIDEQLKGPYREWVHEHVFEAQDGGTQVLDRVRYRVPGGRLVNRWLVRPDVERIFAYRQQVMQDLFGPQASPHIPPGNPGS